MSAHHVSIFLLCIIVCSSVRSQDSSGLVSTKYLDQVASTSSKLNKKIAKRSEKTLEHLQKQEAKMKRKLMKIDSLKAKQIFGNVKEDVNKRLTRAKEYIPTLDTLASSLQFLKDNPQVVSTAKNAAQKLKNATAKMNELKSQFQKAESIKKYLKERKQYLKEQLSKFGFAKDLKKINKQVYYYSEQLNEYKSLLKDHKKAEKKAIALLSKTKLFRNFMRKNSELASLFRLPDPASPATAASLAGLQTRAQVNGLIQQQLAAGGAGAQAQFQQNMQQAQSQLGELKNKMMKLGSNSSDAEMPDGFTPNGQKVKGFLKRLEYGSNIQTQRATSYFPVTSDLGLSVGYKLNDKSIIGIGASYKIGLGTGWNRMRFSSQGIGLRSFIDWKLKGSLWISGGYEQNYRNAFNNIAQLQEQSAWQQSGLVGLSKVVSLKTKFFKKTKLQLLWDFLSYGRVPITQPIAFRVGYDF